MKEYVISNGTIIRIRDNQIFIQPPGETEWKSPIDVSFYLDLIVDLKDKLTEKEEENKQLMSMAEDWQRQCVQALVERDKLRKALEEAKLIIRLIDEYGGDPDVVTSYSEKAIEEINAALGEGDKE